MAAEAFRPITTIQEPGLLGMPRTYTSQREVAAETEAPARGSVLGNIFPSHAENFVLSAQIAPKDGKRILTVQHCTPAAWTILLGSTRDADLDAPVLFSQQVVPTPTQAAIEADTDSEYTPINEALSLKRTGITPTAVLDSYLISHPKRISLDLPRVLKSVSVVWNESKDRGQRDNYFNFFASGKRYTARGSNQDSDNSSISLSPDVLLEWEDYSSNNLFATVYLFYIPQASATEAGILAKLNAMLAPTTVSKWPVFKTRSNTISLRGQSASVSVQTSANISRSVDGGSVTAYRNQRGHGDDIRVNLSNGTVQIPPCIHGAITFSGTTSRTDTVEAMATSPIYVSDGTAIVPAHSRTVQINAHVSPSSLEATSPATVPTSGLYLTDMAVQPYEHGYYKVYAEVFDAANLL